MKKPIVVISLLMFISAFANAQISIMPYAQGDFSHYFFSPESSDKEVAKKSKDILKPKLGYTFGVNVNYKFNQNWSLQTGLMFQEMGEKTLKTNFNSNPQIDTWDAFSITHHYQYINIPIQASYHFTTDGKLSPYVALGAALNINTQSFIKSTLYEDELRETTKIDIENLEHLDIRPVNFSTKVDFGFSYELSEKVHLNTFLSGNMLLLTTSKNHIYKQRHFNIGLGIGVGYSI